MSGKRPNVYELEMIKKGWIEKGSNNSLLKKNKFDELSFSKKKEEKINKNGQEIEQALKEMMGENNYLNQLNMFLKSDDEIVIESYLKMFSNALSCKDIPIDDIREYFINKRSKKQKYSLAA